MDQQMALTPVAVLSDTAQNVVVRSGWVVTYSAYGYVLVRFNLAARWICQVVRIAFTNRRQPNHVWPEGIARERDTDAVLRWAAIGCPWHPAFVKMVKCLDASHPVNSNGFHNTLKDMWIK